MAAALLSFKKDSDGKIRVLHVFFGEDEDEAQKHLEAHADVCPKFGPAYRGEGEETVEVPVEIDELPPGDGDEDELTEWVEDVLLGLEEEDEEDV